MDKKQAASPSPQAFSSPALRPRAHIPALLAWALVAISNPALAGDIKASFDLTATPRVIDEGELVEFGLSNLVYSDSETGETLEFAVALGEVDWNYEDGSGGERGNALFWTNHRFIDDRLSAYTVRARYAGGQGSIDIQVNNVPPDIRSLWYSRPAFKEQVVTFDASATDPGLEDQLTFTWDFGDGSNATGERVEHTYAADGTYQATLVVDDGDGGEDAQTFQVLVGTAGSFVISGDVALPRIDITQFILAGSTRNPLAKNTGDACQIRLTMGDNSTGTSFTLTSNLKPGFGVRDYAIGITNEWDGSHEDDVNSQGTFFADLSLPREIAIRDFDGMKIGGPFWSESGSVTVHHFDGKFLELSFEAQLVENVAVEYQPRVASVRGTFATQVEGSVSGVMTGIGNVFSAFGETLDDPEAESTFKGANFYLCGVDETKTFDIEEHVPASNAVNTDFLNPEITISFTEAVDPASIHENVHLEFRGLSGFETIPGSWQPVGGDPRTIQFVPQAHLRDGLIYCVRVDTEEDGIRGRAGEMLTGSDQSFSSSNAAACQTSKSFTSGGSHEFAFATRVELSSARVDLYQVSIVGEGTPLVAGKPTVARVYPEWAGPGVAHQSAKVKKFPARVTVKKDGLPIYSPQRVDIKMPSQITNTEKVNARNSINFFNWRPSSGSGTSSITALIEPVDDAGVVMDYPFEGNPTVAGHWDRKQQLKIDFHFIKVKGECETGEGWGCDWSDEIDPKWREMARDLMLEAGRFTTQVFPVVGTVSWNGPDITVWEPWSGPCSADYAVKSDCYWSGFSNRQRVKTGWVADDLLDAGSGSDADVLVGIVPPGFMPSATAAGWTTEFAVTGKRVILAKLGSINPVGVAHEYGHFFDLDHCPVDIFGDEPSCTPTPIQGYMMNASGQSGFNKNHLEGNQQAGYLFPVMHHKQQELEKAFITTSQYALLFDALESAFPWQAWTPTTTKPPARPTWFEILFFPASAYAEEPPEHSMGELMMVSGSVRGGEILIEKIRPVEANDMSFSSTLSGPYALELKNTSGTVLQSVPFAINTQDRWHGDPTQATRFRVRVAKPAGLHSIGITGPGGAKSEFTRSANPPEVSASVITDSSSGSRILTWAISDADHLSGDDILLTDIYLRADNEGPWQGVAMGIDQKELRIPADQLPTGSSIRAKIIVSDGFNSSSTELDLGPGRPLSVLATIPKHDQKDVALQSDIIAWISNPLKSKNAGTDPIQLPASQFSLTDAMGKPVMADAFYLPAESIITLTPLEPLVPESRYTANVLALTDRWKNSLGQPHSWSFETGAGEQVAFATTEDDLTSPRKISNRSAFPPKEKSTTSGPDRTPPPSAVAPGAVHSSDSGWQPSTGPTDSSSSECSCACDQRASADELCELFCEDEFAACDKP